jgi:hypothetical protein
MCKNGVFGRSTAVLENGLEGRSRGEIERRAMRLAVHARPERYFAADEAASFSQRARSSGLVSEVEVHPVSMMLPRKSISRAFIVSGE